MAAYVLSRFSFKGRNFVMMLILCPMLIPGITNLIPLYAVYAKIGLVNTALGLVLLYLPGLLPLPIVILSNYIKAVPVDLEEAAVVDGCSRPQLLWKIVLPILAPGILAITLINFITVWNEFIVTLIFTSTDDMKTLTLALYQGTKIPTSTMGITNATALTSMVPVIILFLIFRKRFINAMLEGALKG
jgi:ABC-type glycerol-3-phosphate transport system permease component